MAPYSSRLGTQCMLTARNPIFCDKKCSIFTFHNNSRQNGVVLHNCNKNATLNKNACFTVSQKQRQRERAREIEPERERSNQRATESHRNSLWLSLALSESLWLSLTLSGSLGPCLARSVAPALQHFILVWHLHPSPGSS